MSGARATSAPAADRAASTAAAAQRATEDAVAPGDLWSPLAARPTPAALPPDDERRRYFGQVPTAVGRALDGPGRPLDPAVRARFEPRFGAAAAAARVHTDAAAASSAHELRASA